MISIAANNRPRLLPPSSCTYEIDINHLVLHPLLSSISLCSSVCLHDASSDVHRSLSIDARNFCSFVSPHLPSPLRLALQIHTLQSDNITTTTTKSSSKLKCIIFDHVTVPKELQKMLINNYPTRSLFNSLFNTIQNITQKHNLR